MNIVKKSLKNIIKEELNSILLYEYLDKDYMMPLVNNLNMDEKNKIWQNIYNNIEFALSYMEEIYYGYKNKKFENLANNTIRPEIEVDDEETCKKNRVKWTNFLLRRYPKAMKSFSETDLDGYASSFNSNMMFEKPTVFKNGWVIHFTNKPFSILRDGFKGLSKDENTVNRLWRTYGTMQKHLKNEGYCFAFDVNDRINNDYGNYGIIFRTSGIKTRNVIDHENQVIFNARQANMKEVILLHIIKKVKSNSYNGDGDVETEYSYEYEIIEPSTKKSLYMDSDFHKTVYWAIDNIRQYRNINAFSYKNHKYLHNHDIECEKEMNYLKNELIERSKKYIIYYDDMPKTAHLIVLSNDGKEKYLTFREIVNILYSHNFKRIKEGEDTFISNNGLEVYLYIHYFYLPYFENMCWEEKYGKIDDSANNTFVEISMVYDDDIIN